MSGLTLEKRGWILFASGETAMSVAGVNQHHKDATEHRRRIVAAVNGTAGISTEALEAGVVAKLAEALELADATLRGANMDKAHVEKVVSTALALTRGEQS